MTSTRDLRWLIACALLALASPPACSDGGVVGGECRPGGCSSTGGAAGDASAVDADASDAVDGSDSDALVDGGDAEGGDGSAGDADASDVACVPPFDTPAQCGDCFTQCGSAAPVCSPVDGGHACVPLCTPPLVDCGGSCVDTTSDPDHCGACSNQCPSGICQASQCVGASPGHVVVLCMSFEQNSQASPQTALLGNAVFLPVTNPVRILAYGEHSPNPIENKVDQAIGWAATAKNRTAQLTHVNAAAQVTAQLDKQSFDVLLVYDQTGAPSGALAAAGTAWAAAIGTFVKAGGVVVVPTGGGGTGEMGQLLTNAGLLAVSAQPSATGSVLYNQAPSDAVGLNVISPFIAQKQSCTLTTSAVPGPSTVFVVTNAPADAGAGSPVVVHRIP